MPEKYDKELATELTVAWVKANAELKGVNGASKLGAFSIGLVQSGYTTFLKTIRDPESFDSSK